MEAVINYLAHAEYKIAVAPAKNTSALISYQLQISFPVHNLQAYSRY